jgi:glycosyltransferase involved in cell wall biosynthesis
MWLVPVLRFAMHGSKVADLNQPEWQSPPGTPLPSLTIVVPARNEQAEIEPALRSLMQLNFPQYEIIAVDDRSTDATGAILDRLAAEPQSGQKPRVLHVRELPAGWLGKTHAMWLGARQGTGDYILFTDADCVFQPDTLRRAIYYATRTATDHLVLFPTVHMRTLGESMMIAFPQVMSHFSLRPWKVRDPSAKDHIGVGAFNLVRRAAYEQIGAYEKLRLEVVDDIKLGEAVKLGGLRSDVVFGRDLVSLRWAVGASGVVANLEKNLFAFLRYRISLVMAVCVTVFFLCVLPFAGLMFAPGWSRTGFALAVGTIAWAYALTARYSSVATPLFVTCPVAGIIFVFATLQSAFIALRDGAVTWRGTKYSLKELKKGS